MSKDGAFKVVVKKGYRLEVKSWENDGDNSKTETVTYDNKDKALAVVKICKELFGWEDYNNGGGIGNMTDDEGVEGKYKIISYLQDNPNVIKGLGLMPFEEFKKDVLSTFEEATDDDYLEWIGELYEEKPSLFKKHLEEILDILSDTVGNGEYYFCRVCDGVSLFYSPEDVKLERIPT